MYFGSLTCGVMSFWAPHVSDKGPGRTVPLKDSEGLTVYDTWASSLSGSHVSERSPSAAAEALSPPSSLLPPKSEFARVTNRLLPRRRQPPPTAATCAATVRSPGKSPPPRAAHGLLLLLTRSLLPASPTTKTNQSPSPPVIRGSFFHYCCDLVLLGSWGLGRKLGVGQGHGVIRASDRALRGRVVGGQCCCSLGGSFHCDGGWVEV